MTLISDPMTRAKDAMFAHTDTKQAPRYVVSADVKKRARLNCISRPLSYQSFIPENTEC